MEPYSQPNGAPKTLPRHENPAMQSQGADNIIHSKLLISAVIIPKHLHLKCIKAFYLINNLIFFSIVIRIGKVVWKQGSYCWYFRLTLKNLGWLYKEYIKTAKNGGFCEELRSENNCEAVLATFCCYEYDANTSETVQKIATVQKDYHKCSWCVIVCWIVKIYQ